MDNATVIERLREALPDAIQKTSEFRGVASIFVGPESIVEAAAFLRDDPDLSYNFLENLCGVDYLGRDPRFEVVYHLLSVPNRARVRLKVRVAGSAADEGIIPTVQSVWPGAGWPEREVWDMFGIVFSGHPDLRRLLMPEDWEGHPARKDYPVQIQKAAQTYEPLEVTEEEFRANIERDRVRRG